MERLTTLLDEFGYSEKEIYEASENKPGEKVYSVHDSKSEFQQNEEDDGKSDLEESIFVIKHRPVLHKGKSNQKD